MSRFWDIYGQALQQPVWQLLGGVQRGLFQTHQETRTHSVVPYCTIVSDVWGGASMFDQQTRRVEQLREFGYRAFKIEPMMSSSSDVVELARRTRKLLGPELTLMVDVGYLFNDVPTVAKICRELEELDIFFF